MKHKCLITFGYIILLLTVCSSELYLLFKFLASRLKAFVRMKMPPSRINKLKSFQNSVDFRRNYDFLILKLEAYYEL